jgi:hypothetical protein
VLICSVGFSRLLLLAAATGRSLSALAKTCDAAPSDESVRLALLFNLPASHLLLLDYLLDALHQLVPASARRHPLGAALDLHSRPYYGAPHTPGTYGGKREAGTRRFWVYGSLAVLQHGLRVTVGLCPVEGQGSLVRVVRTLIEQAQHKGIQLKWLLLDRGFYDAQIIAYLQAQKIPFVMPMIRRGNAKTGTGTQPFFRLSACGWHEYSWTSRPRTIDEKTGKKKKGAALTVTVRACVVAGVRNKVWVYACWGVNWTAALLRKRYRSRFGIETSYRQLGACLPMTTSKKPCVRLLLVGLALLIRQYWVWVHYVTLAKVLRNGHRQLQSEVLRLDDVLMWLLLTLTKLLHYRLALEIITQTVQTP